MHFKTKEFFLTGFFSSIIEITTRLYKTSELKLKLFFDTFFAKTINKSSIVAKSDFMITETNKTKFHSAPIKKKVYCDN